MAAEQQDDNENVVSRRQLLTLGGTLLTGGAAATATQTDLLTNSSDNQQEPPNGAVGTTTREQTTTTEKETTTTAEETTTQNVERPDKYRVDLKNTSGENIGSHNTETNIDDHVVDFEKLDEWHENDYQEFGEPQFVNLLTEDQIVTESPPNVYPNYDDPDTPERGEWSFEAFTEAETLEGKYEWLGRAWLNYAQKKLGGISSTQQFKLAPTIEEAFEEHTDLEVHAWGFNSPMIDKDGGNHGSDLLHDQTNDQLYLIDPAPKTRQMIATPTESNYNPENGHNVTEEVWHPLWYQGGNPDTNQLNYERAKEAAVGMMRGVASQDLEVEEELPSSRTNTITDQYLQSVLEPARNGTLSEQAVEHIQILSKLTVESYDTGNDVLLYGTVDDSRYAVGEGMDDLVEGVNATEETYTIEDVESTLEGTTA